MKVFLIKIDNGEMYEDYQVWTEAVFATYRDATQYLMDQGFNFDYEIDDNDEYYLTFDQKISENEWEHAEIIEMEVIE